MFFHTSVVWATAICSSVFVMASCCFVLSSELRRNIGPLCASLGFLKFVLDMQSASIIGESAPDWIEQ
jgi:hypothetical protein